jgi:hypothetical protein
MAMSRYTKSSSAMTLTMTVSIYPSYNFSQSTVYSAPDRKNAMITPMKIKSLIRVSISAT